MILSNAIAIGFTGPFGSGSTTSARIIAEHKHYHVVRLSELIKSRWDADHPGQEYTRSDLQRLGNQIRVEANDPGALVVQALRELDEGENQIDHLIVDGIRNLGEIERLRSRFESRFYLFALECEQSERWERVKLIYESQKLTVDQFNLDNEEDKDQEDDFGQQVQLCVDQADVLIGNGDEVPEANRIAKLIEYVELITGEKPRYANHSEIHMNLAYS
jgi:dephospho-CoA kinase